MALAEQQQAVELPSSDKLFKLLMYSLGPLIKKDGAAPNPDQFREQLKKVSDLIALKISQQVHSKDSDPFKTPSNTFYEESSKTPSKEVLSKMIF